MLYQTTLGRSLKFSVLLSFDHTIVVMIERGQLLGAELVGLDNLAGQGLGLETTFDKCRILLKNNPVTCVNPTE